MPRGKVLFKERDVARALQAVAKSGTPPQKIEIDREGKIIIIFAEPRDQQDLDGMSRKHLRSNRTNRMVYVAKNDAAND